MGRQVRVILYTSATCVDCEGVSRILERLTPQYGLEVVQLSVTGDTALSEAYAEKVPVVEVEGGALGRLEAPIDEAQVRLYLEIARYILEPRADVVRQTGWRETKIDRVIDYMAVHWLRFVEIGLGIYVGLPWLAPIFAALGWWGLADPIYTAYAIT